jgi:hypothetical protein
MAGPIYKLWMSKPNEAWFQLTEEEQNGYITKLIEAREKVGGKDVVTCDPFWSAHPWMGFGADEYPDIEAAQKSAELISALNYSLYFETVSMLGTRYAVP